MSEPTKTCGHCKQDKPRSEFFNNCTRPSGLHSWCKQCCAEDDRARRRTRTEFDREGRRISGRRFYARYRETITAKRRERLQDPEVLLRERAHSRVHRAIASGLLEKPEACSRCGTTPPRAVDGRSKLHAHHADYSKPLEVEWLCISCHQLEHLQEAAA